MFNKKYFFACAMLLVLITPLVLSIDDVEINPLVLRVSIEKGNFVNSPVSLINTGSAKTFNIGYFPQNGFVFVDPSETTQYIDDGSSSNFNVLLGSTYLEPGVYVGEVSVSSKNEFLIIPVTLEVETFSPLFDVTTETLQGTGDLVSGGEFVIDVNVIKFKGQREDVTLSFDVRNTRGESIYSEVQDLKVPRQTKLTKSIPIPDDAVGNYIFSVVARDVSSVSVGTSSQIFVVSPDLSPEASQKSSPNVYIIGGSFGVILMLIISFLIFNHFWNTRLVENAKHWDKRLTEIRKIKLSDTAKAIKKLEYQKLVLEKAYEKRYIKRDSYDEGRIKINDHIRRLKKRL